MYKTNQAAARPHVSHDIASTASTAKGGPDCLLRAKHITMMPPTSPIAFDDENPEWTDEDFARARPADEALPAEAAALLVRKRGRPAGSRNAASKSQVTLRLDADVIAAFKSGGPGWQTRMNDALREAATRIR